MSLCNINDYKDWTQVDRDDTTKDDVYQALIDRAESKLKLYANTPIHEEIHDAKRVIIPKYLPISNVVSLKAGAILPDYDGYLLEENYDYYVYRYHIYLKCPSDLRKSINLDYVGGYLTTDEDFPEMIHAVCLTVSYWLDITQKVAPDTNIDYRIPKEISKILKWRSRI